MVNTGLQVFLNGNDRTREIPFDSFKFNSKKIKKVFLPKSKIIL